MPFVKDFYFYNTVHIVHRITYVVGINDYAGCKVIYYMVGVAMVFLRRTVSNEITVSRGLTK
jgi:hypothetical protein